MVFGVDKLISGGKVWQMWLLLSPSPGQNLSQLFYPDRLNLFLRHLFYLNDSGYFFSFVSISQINNSRPKPTYGRPGLDWIVWPGYSFGVFSMSRFAPPALSSVDAPKTLRDQQGDLSDPHDFFSEFFISFFHINHIISCPKVLEAYWQRYENSSVLDTVWESDIFSSQTDIFNLIYGCPNWPIQKLSKDNSDFSTLNYPDSWWEGENRKLKKTIKSCFPTPFPLKSQRLFHVFQVLGSYIIMSFRSATYDERRED